MAVGAFDFVSPRKLRSGVELNGCNEQQKRADSEEPIHLFSFSEVVILSHKNLPLKWLLSRPHHNVLLAFYAFLIDQIRALDYLSQ